MGSLSETPMIPLISHFRNFMGNGTSCDKESLSCSKEFEINKVFVGTSFRRNDFWDLLCWTSVTYDWLP